MSHNLVYNSKTGIYEVMTRGAAWHGLGQVVENAQTWEETIKLAGLNWTVSKEQHKSARTGEPIADWGIYRDDNDAFLGAVGSAFHPVQNLDRFKFVDDILERENGAHYECAGALGNGETVFALANLADAFEIVEGDRHENYLLFVGANNSDYSEKCFLTSVRVVCANTLREAIAGSAKGDVLKFKHTKNVQARMTEAARLITDARAGVSMLKEKLARLATREMSHESYEDIVNRLFPKPKVQVVGGAVQVSKGAETRRTNILSEILDLYESNDKNAFPEIRGTAYNFFNAVTEYVDHVRKPVRTDVKDGWTDEQLQSKYALFDGGADLKTSALDVILQATAGNDFRPQRKSFGMPQTSLAGAPVASTVVLELDAPTDAPASNGNGAGGGGSILDEILGNIGNN